MNLESYSINKITNPVKILTETKTWEGPVHCSRESTEDMVSTSNLIWCIHEAVLTAMVPIHFHSLCHLLLKCVHVKNSI